MTKVLLRIDTLAFDPMCIEVSVKDASALMQRFADGCLGTFITCANMTSFEGAPFVLRTDAVVCMRIVEDEEVDDVIDAEANGVYTPENYGDRDAA